MTRHVRLVEDVRPLLGRDVVTFLRNLGGPSWFRVEGRNPSARVRAVTTLLHGNEPSGARAVHAWLSSGVVPAADVVFYIGSVAAALAPPPFTHRVLPGRLDANRTFGRHGTTPEGQVSSELLSLLAVARPEALVDLHNNSGHSPAYGVGTLARPEHLSLASLFVDRYMLNDLRLGTLLEATEHTMTSIVIECGRAGDPVADAVALAGLERYLAIDALPGGSASGAILEVLHRPIRVMIAADVAVAFDDAPVPGMDLTLVRDLDRHNFETVGAGATIGWLGPRGRWPLHATGGDGRDVSRELFAEDAGALSTRRSMVPIMMTCSADMAKLDCLFYAMERR